MQKINSAAWVWMVGALALLTSLLAVPAQYAGAQDDDGSVTLTLLHNNDGESKLIGDPETGFPGIARFTELIQMLGNSTEADILLRLSAGDNFLASKEFSAGLARAPEPLFDSVALGGLYEAMGLGNHDFDFGPEVTADFIAGFNPPVTFLAANIDVSREPALQALADQGRIAASKVVTDPTTGQAVGVIGAVTPRLPNISSPGGVVVDADVAAAVNAEAEELELAGINRIVLVSHLQGLEEDRDLVPQLSGIDVVVAGGGDELLKNDGDTCMPDESPAGAYPLVLQDADGTEVPVVTAPGGYRCIGRLDVRFDADGSVIEWAGTSLGVPLDGPTESFALDNVETPLREAVADLESQVLATSDVELDGRRDSVRTGPSNVGQILAAALLSAGQSTNPPADIAIQNAGGIRNDSVIPSGEITAADTFDIAPFANFAVNVEIERDRLKALLEVAVAGLPESAGNYPQIAGFTMTVDPDQPAQSYNADGDCKLTGEPGSRVRSVTLDDGTEIIERGKLVAGGPVVLATIDFLARGGDCYPLRGLPASNVGVSYQQALANFIQDDLGGQISADTWPVDGRGEGAPAIGASDDADTGASEPAPVTAATTGASESEDAASDTSAASSGDGNAAGSSDSSGATQQLPNTGLDSWMWFIAALTAAAGGAMIWFESRRASLRSLATRLVTTRPWDPSEHDTL